MKALRCGAAALIDEAGPTASHGGSFVHQGQSHPGGTLAGHRFRRDNQIHRTCVLGVRIHLLTAN